MIFHAFQREDGDNVFTVVRNVSGDAWVAGYPVALDVTSTRDGVRCTKPTAAALCAFRGVVSESIADSAYGKVQVHGFFTDASCINTTDVTGQPGSPLVISGANYYMAPVVQTGTGYEGFAVLLESFAIDTTPAAAAKDIFIRAL